MKGKQSPPEKAHQSLREGIFFFWETLIDKNMNRIVKMIISKVCAWL